MTFYGEESSLMMSATSINRALFVRKLRNELVLEQRYRFALPH